MTNSIVVYNDVPLEKRLLKFSNAPKTITRSQETYLASEIFVSEYGIAGFNIVDSKPTKRWIRYDEADWTGIDVNECPFPDADEARQQHFIDTDKGFALFRCFVLPNEVSEFFMKDKFLGGAFIDKCCRDQTMPEDFDEERVLIGAGFSRTNHIREYIVSELNKQRQSYNEAPVGNSFKNQEIYISFHGWPFYQSVIAKSNEGVMQSLANFDAVLKKFDGKNVVPRQDLKLMISGIIVNS